MGNSRSQPALRIGAIFMRSGPIDELGTDSFDGADVALRLVNDHGGVNERPLAWVSADGSTPDEAARQAERMIEAGVRIIVGCYGSDHTIAVSKVCERHKARNNSAAQMAPRRFVTVPQAPGARAKLGFGGVVLRP